MGVTPYFNDKTLPEVARDAARKWPRRTALCFYDETVTFAEQYHRACCLAHGLASLGIGRGDHVATLISGRPEWFYLSYAISLLGAVIVPINVTFRQQELDHVLRCADVKALITIDEFRGTDHVALFRDLIPELDASAPGFLRSARYPCLSTVITFSPEGQQHPGCFDFQEVMDSGRHYRPWQIEHWHQMLAPTDPAYILFTSGSTAFPKPALRDHGSCVGIAHHLYGSSFRFGPDDVMLGLSPFYHVGGCVYVTLGCGLSGARLVLMDSFDPGRALQLIAREGITCMSGFDTHFRGLSSHPDFAGTDVSRVGRLQLACGPEWYDKVRELGFGSISVTHHYGFTEGTSVVMPDSETDPEIRKYSNGKPFPGCEVRVIDPDSGQECAANQPGELCVRGWTLFLGYYKMPRETAASFDEDGFFHSGDYGWKDDAGYIYYRGRYKQMIKTGGENVSQREVEMFLEQHPGIATVQVVGVPDERWGEAVTALIEPRDASAPLDVETIRAFCKENIAGFKIPKHVIVVERSDWPITLTGKFDKPALRKLAMSRLGLSE